MCRPFRVDHCQYLDCVRRHGFPYAESSVLFHALQDMEASSIYSLSVVIATDFVRRETSVNYGRDSYRAIITPERLGAAVRTEAYNKRSIFLTSFSGVALVTTFVSLGKE